MSRDVHLGNRWVVLSAGDAIHEIIGTSFFFPGLKQMNQSRRLKCQHQLSFAIPETSLNEKHVYRMTF